MFGPPGTTSSAWLDRIPVRGNLDPYLRSESVLPMTGWVIIVDRAKDVPLRDPSHKAITTDDYLARPRMFDTGCRELLNLSASYKYRSKGYYASLLAEARGHPILPSVETMLELREDKLCEHALPQLEDALNRDARRADFSLRGKFKLLV